MPKPSGGKDVYGICPQCNGTGKRKTGTGEEECPRCAGAGYVIIGYVEK